MKLVRILLILLISQSNCYGQRNKSDSLINKFRDHIQAVQKERSGTVAMNDETRELYYSVIINCPVKDLIKYTNDSNAFVRSHIFAGLLRKKIKNDVLFKILATHKNDTAEFTIKSTDVVITWTVIEFMKVGMRLKTANGLSNINYKKEIEKIRSRIKNEIKIQGSHNGLIEKEQLLKYDSLVLTMTKLKIVSFTLLLPGRSIKSSSNALTNDMKTAIKETPPGDILIFTEINVLTEENNIRQWVSISIKLK